MLFDLFAPIRNSAIVRILNRFFYSPAYMILVAGLMAISNVFAREFTVFYCYAAFCIYITLFAPDLFPAAPMFCCGYMLFSANNNPATNFGNDIFASPEGRMTFIVLLVTAVGVLVIRLIYELVAKKHNREKFPKLTLGFLALGIAYVIGGIFSEFYSLGTAVFGFLQIVSLCFTYFFFWYGVDWSKRKASDAAWMFCAIGFGIMAEIIGMYFRPEVIEAIQNGTFQRIMLLSGWGIYNNVGAMMAMMIPIPFYFAATGKCGPLWLLPACLFFIATIFTQSRGAIMTGALIFLACMIATVVCSRGKLGLLNALALLGLGILSCISVTMLWDPYMTNLFAHFNKSDLFESNGRLEIYRYGLENFCKAPVFGNGFYHVDSSIIYQHGVEMLPENSFLPPRYHNTIIQLLASGGIVALIAYLYHRIQTVILILRKKSAIACFLGLSLLAHLIASMLDCHFFNFGPGLTYGVMLVCIERIQKDATVCSTEQ